MTTDTIKRGNIVIGTITYENGASALGMEVVATAAFPPPDGESGTDQFESYEAASKFVHFCYETHCEAAGITLEPRDPEPTEADAEAAHQAHEAARDAEEAAHYERLMDPNYVDPALGAEESGYLEAFIAAKPELPSEEDSSSDGSEDDDLPF
jgi:hypothetical protein